MTKARKWLCIALAGIVAIGCLAPMLAPDETQTFALVLVEEGGGETVSFEGTTLTLSDHAWVTRDDVASFTEIEDGLVIELRPESIERFHRLTGEHVGERVAIVVDGQIVSAPIIRAPIEAGRIVVTFAS